LFSDEGKIDEAMKSINEAIQIWTDELGLEHIKTAKSIYLKGNLYLRMKNTVESNYMPYIEIWPWLNN